MNGFKDWVQQEALKSFGKTASQMAANIGADTTMGAIGAVAGSVLGGPVGTAAGALGGAVMSQVAQRIINAFVNRKEDPVKAIFNAMNMPDHLRGNDRVAQALDLPDDLSSAVSDQVKTQIAQEVAVWLQKEFSKPNFNINAINTGITTIKLVKYLNQLVAKYKR